LFWLLVTMPELLSSNSDFRIRTPPEFVPE